jgi:hypothetical protein
MAIQWFGECSSDGSNPGGGSWDSISGNQSIWNYNRSYTCPGSGTMLVRRMQCYVQNADDGGLRLGIYDNSGNRVHQYGPYDPNSEVSGWQGYSYDAGTDQLTGGASYRFWFFGNSYDGYYLSGSTGDVRYDTNDYSSGLPSTLPSGTDWNGRYMFRCGVEEQSTGILEQEGFRFRNDDGSESAATWKAAQDTNINLAAATVTRLRFLINATGDPTERQFKLEYRHKPSGGSFGIWKPVINPQ